MHINRAHACDCRCISLLAVALNHVLFEASRESMPRQKRSSTFDASPPTPSQIGADLSHVRQLMAAPTVEAVGMVAVEYHGSSSSSSSGSGTHAQLSSSMPVVSVSSTSGRSSPGLPMGASTSSMAVSSRSTSASSSSATSASTTASTPATMSPPTKQRTHKRRDKDALAPSASAGATASLTASTVSNSSSPSALLQASDNSAASGSASETGGARRGRAATPPSPALRHASTPNVLTVDDDKAAAAIVDDASGANAVSAVSLLASVFYAPTDTVCEYFLIIALWIFCVFVCIYFYCLFVYFIIIVFTYEFRQHVNRRDRLLNSCWIVSLLNMQQAGSFSFSGCFCCRKHTFFYVIH